jgi:hypothetical protein
MTDRPPERDAEEAEDLAALIGEAMLEVLRSEDPAALQAEVRRLLRTMTPGMHAAATNDATLRSVGMRAAAKDRPRVARALLAAEMPRPESDPYGVAVGGEEEAWLYREDMRETWQATPDALEFLRSVAPPLVRATRRRGKAR